MSDAFSQDSHFIQKVIIGSDNKVKNGPVDDLPKVDTRQHAELLLKIEKMENSQFDVSGKISLRFGIKLR